VAEFTVPDDWRALPAIMLPANCYFPVLAAGGSDDRFMPLLALTLLATVLCTLLLRRFRLPALPGYFLCGFLLARLSPLSLSPGTEAAESLQRMADVGILLLMFTVGAEGSRHELKMMRRNGLAAGLWQMGLTGGLAGLTALAAGWSALASATAGVAVGLSSTAVGVKLFDDAGIREHPGARLTLGIALVQDIIVIIFLLILQGAGSSGKAPWASLAAKGIVFLACAALLSRFGVPLLLRAVSRTRSRELFTLAVLALCSGVAALGQSLGLGLSLGAFAAGVAVSGSVYSHRILADAAPFRDFFLTVFFLSVGAMVDLPSVAAAWPWVLSGIVLALTLKPVLTLLAARFSGASAAAGRAAALALAGCGEFSVVLGQEAAERGIIPGAFANGLLAVTAFSLTISPFLMKLAVSRGWLRERSAGTPLAPGKTSASAAARRVKELRDHAILCGYGTVGEMVHRGLVRLGIPVVIIELNAETVGRLKAEGHAVLFADIAQADTLELAGIDRARLLVVTFPHAETARTVITLARERNPDAMLLCRARFPDEAEMLRGVAPGGVVHDELEAGAKMLRMCSRAFGSGSEGDPIRRD
jgi:CPA2 family monovalent cation:H+ antiporter-2